MNFNRPIGAAIDVKELEYVSALHQTAMPDIRLDGSITVEDIRAFLMSRYGIRVSKEYIRKTVLAGLGGGDDEDDCIDLMEMVAMILIPTLIKAAAAETVTTSSTTTSSCTSSTLKNGTDDHHTKDEENIPQVSSINNDDNTISSSSVSNNNKAKNDTSHIVDGAVPVSIEDGGCLEQKSNNEEEDEAKPNDETRNATTFTTSASNNNIVQPPKGLLQYVLNMILHDVTESIDPPPLTKDLLRTIFKSYGEQELSQDDELLEEMIHVATSTSRTTTADGSKTTTPLLDVRAFARGLTSDVQLYDETREITPTSRYTDAIATLTNHQQQQRNTRDCCSLYCCFCCCCQTQPLPIQPTTTTMTSISSDEENHVHSNDTMAVATSSLSTTTTRRNKDQPQIFKVSTVEILDNVADTQASKALSVFAWASFIILYFLRSNAEQQFFEALSFCASSSTTTNRMEDGISGDDFACLIFEKILFWILKVIIIAGTGLTTVGLVSIGNRQTDRLILHTIFGLVCSISLSFFFFNDWFKEFYEGMAQLIPYEREYSKNGGDFEDDELDPNEFEWDVVTPAVEKDSNKYLMFIGTICATIVVLCHINQLIALISNRLLPKLSQIKEQHLPPLLQYMFTPGGDIAEVTLKQAASHKVHGMIMNALDVTHSDQLEGQDNVMDTYFGQALFAFSKIGKQYEPAGGVLWTWKHLANGTLFRTEGIWFTTRLLANNLTQFVISIFLLWSGILLISHATTHWTKEHIQDQATEGVGALLQWMTSTVMEASTQQQGGGNGSSLLLQSASSNYSGIVSDYIAQQYFGTSNLSNIDCSVLATEDAASSSLWSSSSLASSPLYDIVSSSTNSSTNFADNYGCGDVNISSLSDQELLDRKAAALQASGFDFNAMDRATEHLLQTAAQQSVHALYPNEISMITTPMWVATILSFLVALGLAIVYIPSATSTTLQLRSGVIPTFRSTNFFHLRVAPDVTTLLTGGLFWGCIYSSLAFGSFIAFIVFLFLWQVTNYYMMHFLAIIIGVTVTVLIRVLIMIACRRLHSKSLYRIRPGQSNIFLFIMECMLFALNVFFTFMRLLKLVLLSILYVGRVDSRFLAPGVGKFGPLDLDAFPTIFLKDVLQHEAHRHPYIELMGSMYLMNLFHGNQFCNRAGSTWRLLFVFALFPWLAKYRIITRADMRDGGNTNDEQGGTMTMMNDIKKEQQGVIAVSNAETQNDSDKCKRNKSKTRKGNADHNVSGATSSGREYDYLSFRILRNRYNNSDVGDTNVRRKSSTIDRDDEGAPFKRTSLMMHHQHHLNDALTRNFDSTTTVATTAYMMSRSKSGSEEGVTVVQMKGNDDRNDRDDISRSAAAAAGDTESNSIVESISDLFSSIAGSSTNLNKYYHKDHGSSSQHHEQDQLIKRLRLRVTELEQEVKQLQNTTGPMKKKDPELV